MVEGRRSDDAYLVSEMFTPYVINLMNPLGIGGNSLTNTGRLFEQPSSIESLPNPKGFKLMRYQTLVSEMLYDNEVCYPGNRVRTGDIQINVASKGSLQRGTTPLQSVALPTELCQEKKSLCRGSNPESSV